VSQREAMLSVGLLGRNPSPIGRACAQSGGSRTRVGEPSLLGLLELLCTGLLSNGSDGLFCIRRCNVEEEGASGWAFTAVTDLNCLFDWTLQPLPVVGPLAFQPEGTVVGRPRSTAVSTPQVRPLDRGLSPSRHGHLARPPASMSGPAASALRTLEGSRRWGPEGFPGGLPTERPSPGRSEVPDPRPSGPGATHDRGS